jgi:hypothetical protein
VHDRDWAKEKERYAAEKEAAAAAAAAAKAAAAKKLIACISVVAGADAPSVIPVIQDLCAL